jgi:hypothetical protein
MRSIVLRAEALRLSAEGLTDREVSAATGVSKATVGRWRRIALGGRPRGPRPSPVTSFRPGDAPAYSYLLGLYLGDGCVCRRPPSWALQITLDALYPGIVREAVAAIEAAAPGRHARPYWDKDARRCNVVSSWRGWPAAFPQHGPGRKHERPIVLAAWQREIVDAHPEAFLRGLIHSDGCRCVNRFRTTLPSGRVAEYAYPRYFFSNLSPDIRRLFCEACDALGIRWTMSNPRNVSVSHRKSVARLDEFVGPKC